MKKILSAVLSLLLLIESSGLNVLAFDDIYYRNTLINRGYPVELVNEMNIEEIIYHVENDFYFAGEESYYVDFESEGINNSDLVTYGTITDSEMIISLTKTISKDTSGKLKQIYINVQYKWLIETVFGGNEVDAWGIAWDHENIRLDDSVDYYTGYTKFTRNGTVFNTKTYDSLARSGVSSAAGWVDQYPAGSNSFICRHNQTLYLRPVSGTSTKTGEVQFYASYCHKQFGGASIGIDIPTLVGVPVGFSVPTGVFSDEKSVAFTVRW